MPCQLTLLVPGLLQPPQSLQALPPQEQPTFIFLNRFLSRARQTPLVVNGFYTTLFSLFGHMAEQQTDHPAGALTRLFDTGEHSDEWSLRCDPACFQADMDRVVLMGHGALGLSMEDVEQLVTIINDHVQQDGWQIEALSPDCWYVKGAKQAKVFTTPPLAVLGQDIKDNLPTGPDGSYWRSLMNESQMLLHELPLNLERQAKGLLPVNGLWFWGGGILPTNTTCQYDAVYGEDPLLAGLAQHAGCVFERTEKVWPGIQQGQDGQLLLVIEDLQLPLASQDLFYWLDGVKQFEQAIIQPLLNMLKTGQLSQVTLLTADGRSFLLTPKLLQHWWKRQAKFSSLLQEA